MTGEDYAAKRRPRNGTKRLIKLRKGQTQLIIIKCTIMEVAKMLHIKKILTVSDDCWCA